MTQWLRFVAAKMILASYSRSNSLWSAEESAAAVARFYPATSPGTQKAPIAGKARSNPESWFRPHVGRREATEARARVECSDAIILPLYGGALSDGSGASSSPGSERRCACLADGSWPRAWAGGVAGAATEGGSCCGGIGAAADDGRCGDARKTVIDRSGSIRTI
jgi:hypothetical protein